MSRPASVDTGTLVVGASQAGLQVAASLRELGEAGSVLLVGCEELPPYERPPLSKAFLSGEVDGVGLALRSSSWYSANDIDLRCGEKVVDIDLVEAGRAGSGVATTRSGVEIGFQRLALAVGGRVRRLVVPGHQLDGVCYLRDLSEAHRFRDRLRRARRIVVVGGGFVGLEVAAAARVGGKDVTVVEVADRLLARAVAPVVSAFYRTAHERRGTRVLLGSEVSSFVGSGGRVVGVELANGTSLPADLVLVGIGVAPRTELAEAIGLEVAGGIVVDAYARTSNPAIVAAGDCTVLPHPLTGLGRFRIESVQNAVTQGRIAAASLLGRREDVRKVPWFWSDQADLKLQIAGLDPDYDGYVVRGDPDAERFSVLYYRGPDLVAADSVNAPRDFLVVRKALGDGLNIPAGRAGDLSVSLRDLVEARPAYRPAAASRRSSRG